MSSMYSIYGDTNFTSLTFSEWGALRQDWYRYGTGHATTAQRKVKDPASVVSPLAWPVAAVNRRTVQPVQPRRHCRAPYRPRDNC